MDYEKEYKEALGRAKAGKPMNEVFPELKESDDERIRKEIIEFLTDGIWRAKEISKVRETQKYAKWIAYLEKQKEQKPMYNLEIPAGDVASAEEDGPFDEDEFLEDELSAFLQNYDKEYDDDVVVSDVAKHFYELGKKVKQQPAEWSEDYRGEDLRTRFAFYTYKDEDDALYLSNVFVEETSRNKGFGTKILAAAEKVAETIGAINIRLKVKQNSPANAWYRKHGYGYMAFEGDYDWLEKTLEYLKPINPEWSEEDALYLSNAILAAESYWKEDSKTTKWLKSLRPQPKEDLNAIAQREYARGKQDGYWEGVKAERESCKTFHYESPNWPPKMPDLPTETTTNEGVSSIQPHWKPSDVQMEALAWYSGNSGVPPTGDKAIKSLYIDLQKLL